MVWSFPATSVGRVTLDDSLVFFAGANHELIALEKSSGKLAWRAHTTYTSGVTQGFGTTVAGPVVILADYWLWAYDRRTGAPRWIYDLGAAMAPGYELPATNGTRVFAAGVDGQVAALHPATGAELWRRSSPMPYPEQANGPSVDGDDLYVCYSGHYPGLQGGLVSFNATTGAVQWIHDYTQYVSGNQSAFCTTATIVTESVLFSWFGRGDVVALNRADGTLRWRKPPPVLSQGASRRYSALVDGVLAVGSIPGDLEGLDPADGTRLWRVYFAPASIFWPLAADETTVYPTYGGHIAAIEARNGRVKWVRGFDSKSYLGVDGTPAVDDSTVYAGGDGGLFAIRK